MKMKYLCILSLPRSGTNHLLENILASNRRVLNLSEIFHNMEAGVEADLFKSVFPSYESFRIAVQDDPVGALRRLTEGKDEEIAVFKVFPDHLCQMSFEKLAKKIDGFVVLTRNPLSTWVSNEIALKSGVWFSKRTEDQTISWSFADFLDHSIGRLGYLNGRSAFLRENGMPFVDLNYSEIRRHNADYLEIFGKIAAAVPSMEGLLLSRSASSDSVAADSLKLASERAIFKQDTRAPLMRIENWQQAHADLEHWGLGWLTDEDAPFDRIALLSLLKAIRKVHAKEIEVLAFEHSLGLRLAEGELAAETRVAEVERAADVQIAGIVQDTELRVAEAEADAARCIAEVEAGRHIAELASQIEAQARTHASAEARLDADRRALELRVRECEHAASVLTAGGNGMAEDLRRAYARPWRPIKRWMQRGLLRLPLLVPGLFSDERIGRFRRSLAKRMPIRFATDWDDTIARAWGRPAKPAVVQVVRKSDTPPGLHLAHKSLLALASVSEPFSKRRAERFRRSAEKRDPHRFRGPLTPATPDATFLDAVSKGEPVKDAARARRILVADYRLPRPDLSAGEKATFGLVSDLRALGFDVTFLPTDMENVAPYREALEALGVTVITRDGGFPFGSTYIRTEGAKFGAFYFIRVDVAEALLPSARAVAPDARVIFHAPDLSFLREGRAAELGGKPGDLEAVAKVKAREAAIMRASDHVVLVSPAEVPFVADIVPGSRISVFPALYSPAVTSPAGYGARQDVFFLGGFKHPPNVDAVTWFVDSVWPAVHAQLPDVEFHILGAEAPEQVIALGNRPGVRFIGYVPDLDPVLARYRLSVAPLLYGAGIKGKLGMAMGAGVPSVTTAIGAEGMGIVDGVHALVCDAPDAFAEAIARLYTDDILWQRIAQKGRQLVAEKFGEAANQASFFRVLDKAGALPLSLYIEHCKTFAPAALPDPDPAEAVDVSIIVSGHNQWSVTQPCLNSVLLALRSTGLVCEVILVDDGSTDATLQAASMFPGLRVVRQDVGLGFVGNCNAAAATARGAALLFLNNDSIVMPDWLTGLVSVLQAEPSAAIVGSKLLSLDGTILEAGSVLFSDATTARPGFGQRRNELLHAFDREVDQVSAASFLIRRDFWNSQGGFRQHPIRQDVPDYSLGMAARAQGMQVICAAGSQVLKPGPHPDATGEVTSIPSAATKTLQPWIDQWRDQLERDHLPPATQPEIAASHAERLPFTTARDRRKAGALNILYFSPFPSHPDNHGNQATIQAFGRRFKQMGHKVHFALLQSRMYDSKSVEDMQSAWDSFHILPNSRQLWADGREIPFDDWYQPGLGENVRLLCQSHDIDVVFCSYVFQSKLLEFVPAHTLRVIDTHDKMGNRYDMLRKNGQPLEFFSCTPEEEGAYLRRADVVVARRAEEAEYFNAVSGRQTAVVIPHFEEPMFATRTFDRLSSIGLVASANRINLAIVLDFMRTLTTANGGAPPPFHVHIAGQVRDMIRDLPKEDQAVFSAPWLTLHGFVPKIADFYGMVDLMVSPVTMGTGINVKTVQAMAHGMPLVTTSWGCKGIETGDPMHGFASMDDLVAALLGLRDTPTELDRLAGVSRNRYQRFHADSLVSFSRAVLHVKGAAQAATDPDESDRGGQ